jgi:hypothetical protein
VKLASTEVIVGLAAAIVGVGGGLFASYRAIARWYGQTIGSRRRLATQLNQLAAGVTTRWVEERLGIPAFARKFPSPSPGGISNLREMIYRSRHSWIQVLVDEHDAVVRFSITVTDPRFRFQVNDLTSGQLSARLARTSFADIETPFEPRGRSLRNGAHNREYAEAYWFGNPGNYQWYVLSHNDMGTGSFAVTVDGREPRWFQDGVLRSKDPFLPGTSPVASDAEKFRAKTKVNTLTVLGPWRADPDSIEPLGRAMLAEPRGPDSNQVRVLLPDARERRQRRRRMRRWSRRTLRDVKRHANEIGPETTADGQPAPS